MLAVYFESEIESILCEVRSQARQKYLDSRLVIPEPSSLKIGLLYLYLYSQIVPANKIRAICTATALVQLGLDIHEWVTNEESIPSHQLERHQLQVLAGDYYSSQYFWLLANEGAIEEIQKLSIATRKNNQHKVRLYQLKKTSADHWEKSLALRTEIETSLIKEFVDESDHNWKRIMEETIRLDLLFSKNETDEWNQEEINLTIRDSISELQQSMVLLDNDEICQVLAKMIRPYEQSYYKNLVAEEI